MAWIVIGTIWPTLSDDVVSAGAEVVVIVDEDEDDEEEDVDEWDVDDVDVVEVVPPIVVDGAWRDISI